MKIRITESIEMFSADPTRVGKKDLWVTYIVDEARTYMLTMPVEQATPAEIERRIREAEKARSQVIGKEFTI